MRHKGAFIKACPGTREYVCCRGLEISPHGQGCPMDCTYCALQVYFNRPVLELFVNVDDMISGLRSHVSENPSKFHRICTGEFTDSLALDPLTGLGSRLVEAFSTIENASSSSRPRPIPLIRFWTLIHLARWCLAKSVNSSSITNSEERRAIPIDRRIAAAQRAMKKGYRVRFHFDPIVPHLGWEEEYGETVDKIFRKIDPSGIAWISLGVLRYVRDLKEAVRYRHGPVRYFHDAFAPGLDGKARLYVDRRIRIYRTISDRIRKYHPKQIYLLYGVPACMEGGAGDRHAGVG